MGGVWKNLTAVYELSYQKTTGPELAPLIAFLAPMLGRLFFVSANLSVVILNQAFLGP